MFYIYLYTHTHTHTRVCVWVLSKTIDKVLFNYSVLFGVFFEGVCSFTRFHKFWYFSINLMHKENASGENIKKNLTRPKKYCKTTKIFWIKFFKKKLVYSFLWNLLKRKSAEWICLNHAKFTNRHIKQLAYRYVVANWRYTKT